MVATTKAPTDKRTALAWARRHLACQLRPRVDAAQARHTTRAVCRHERDVRNIARGYLDDHFIDAFPEIVQDGDWPRTAAQLVSYANDFFAGLRKGSAAVFEFYTCDTCYNR
ncbi:hypothetical protein [Glycomyces tenuis]|uniref:hypothetical protein n=1 Tax=Glycomyces tenuis TaxID=58116 RepID=UPI0004287D3C|nr:hypothetical protein [Glycomyces tenuis]